MKKPTQDEINQNIKWLEENLKSLPVSNAFGDNIQSQALADLEVLKNNLSEQDIDDRSHFEDESEEEGEDDSKDWSISQRESAQIVRQWLDGDEEDSPIKNYSHLVGKHFKRL